MCKLFRLLARLFIDVVVLFVVGGGGGAAPLDDATAAVFELVWLFVIECLSFDVGVLIGVLFWNGRTLI